MNVGSYSFLTVENVLELHEMQLLAYGGASGIRSRDLLESAVLTPQASFGGAYVHHDVFEMAAAYAFHIAENQPFLDGNKRTGLAAALVFLDWNEVEIEDPQEQLYDVMIAISQKKISKQDLALLLRKLKSS